MCLTAMRQKDNIESVNLRAQKEKLPAQKKKKTAFVTCSSISKDLIYE